MVTKSGWRGPEVTKMETREPVKASTSWAAFWGLLCEPEPSPSPGSTCLQDRRKTQVLPARRGLRPHDKTKMEGKLGRK